jgi:hypothetical protein
MLERRTWAWGLALAGIAMLIGVLMWRDAQGQKMSEVRFELGKNIVKTAEASGVPRFSTRDVAGLVSYSVNAIPPEIPIRYAKPGYEIDWKPVFAFTMYADRDIHPDLQVETVTMQPHVDAMNDTQAQAFVESTIAQFQKGKWQRYADPEWEVMLTGRSSILDEHGNLGKNLSALDPNYKLSPEEWQQAARSSLVWRWVGDGIVAQLDVRNSPDENGKARYDMDLEFEILAIRKKRFADRQAQDLKDGDAKGWNSTAEHEASKLKAAALNKHLVANAIKRGDAVVPFPRMD